MGNIQEKITLPQGNWSNSATNIEFDENSGLLKCKLITKNNLTNDISILATNGMILENDDGHFNVINVGNKKGVEITSEFPVGTWMTTAKDSTMLSNGVLKSYLRTIDGRYNESLVVVYKGMILENNNGTFKCISFPLGNNQSNQSDQSNFSNPAHVDKVERIYIDKIVEKPMYKIIGGNWIKSARCIELTEHYLYAELQKENGSWIRASYNIGKDKILILENKNGVFIESMN